MPCRMEARPKDGPGGAARCGSDLGPPRSGDSTRPAPGPGRASWGASADGRQAAPPRGRRTAGRVTGRRSGPDVRQGKRQPVNRGGRSQSGPSSSRQTVDARHTARAPASRGPRTAHATRTRWRRTRGRRPAGGRRRAASNQTGSREGVASKGPAAYPTHRSCQAARPRRCYPAGSRRRLPLQTTNRPAGPGKAATWKNHRAGEKGLSSLPVLTCAAENSCTTCEVSKVLRAGNGGAGSTRMRSGGSRLALFWSGPTKNRAQRSPVGE
jgi:hypothetical protein